MSDFSDMAESARRYDMRAEQQQAHERRAFADALESMIKERDKAMCDSVQALVIVLDRAMQKYEETARQAAKSLSAGFEQLTGESSK